MEEEAGLDLSAGVLDVPGKFLVPPPSARPAPPGPGRSGEGGEPLLWQYLRHLRPLVGTAAFSKFQADVSARTFPGDGDDRTLVASYVLSKLRQEAHILRTWERPTDSLAGPLRWLSFYHPRLFEGAPPAGSPSARAAAELPGPGAGGAWVDGRYGGSSEDGLDDDGHGVAAAGGSSEDGLDDGGHAAGGGAAAAGPLGERRGDPGPEPRDVRDRVLNLPQLLQERVLGQEAAVSLAADLVQLCYVGLRDKRGPLGTLLFVGPTGVGKTELAKALAAAVFGSEGDMFRVDMSALKAKGDVATLIGAPRGYQDSAQGGTLTGFFARQKDRKSLGAVVLLDEVEKAHGEVIDLFLPAFDEGYLVDGRGARHDCGSVLFVMTSNLGSAALSKRMREGQAGGRLTAVQVEELVSPYVRKHMRPELLGRVDAIAFFTPLGDEEIRAIVRLQLDQLRERLLAATGGRCTLVWRDSVVRHVAQSAPRPEHGARGVRRAVQSGVAVPLTKLLLSVLPPRRAGRDCQLHIEFDGPLLSAHVVPRSSL